MAGITFGKRIYRLDTVPSTQDFLKEQFLQGEAEGAIAVALEQTLGKGRRGRAWDSPAGKGLWTSMLIIPGGPESLWTWVPLWAGIVAKKAIGELLSKRQIQKEIMLKWPNDLMMDELKLGGIIAEQVTDTKNHQAVVLGLGINLLQRREEFPPHIRGRAISLLEATDQEFSPDALLEKLILEAEEVLPLLKPVDSTKIKEEWLHSAWGLGERLRIFSGDKAYEGTFSGLGPYGEICLRRADGEENYYSSAEGIQRITTS